MAATARPGSLTHLPRWPAPLPRPSVTSITSRPLLALHLAGGAGAGAPLPPLAAPMAALMLEATVEAWALARYPSLTPGAADASPRANQPSASFPRTRRCSSTLTKPAASRTEASERKEVFGAPLKHL